MLDPKKVNHSSRVKRISIQIYLSKGTQRTFYLGNKACCSCKTGRYPILSGFTGLRVVTFSFTE